MARYGEVDPVYAATLATTPEPDDGPIYMLNLMAYREEADYGPGGERGVSGREADDRYAPLDVLAAIGASVCLFADVVASSEPWDRVAVVRYPTRRSFVQMQDRDDFKRQHVHKDAGMARTIIMGTLPAAELPPAGSVDPLLLEVWDGAKPASSGTGADFAVEGTIVGDGRHWTGVRYTPAAQDATLSATDDSSRPGVQRLLLRPLVSRWV